ADGIDGDATDGTPVLTVAGAAKDDVVRRAPRLEAAVLPGHVYVAGGVDLGARQRARPQPAGVRMEANPRDRDLPGPGRPAVRGSEGGDRAPQALERHDHGAVGLHDRLTAE